jgi:hypothetical protein
MLPDASVHAVCTSPPFWGLRRYEGVEPTDWPPVSYRPMPGLPELQVPAMSACLGNEPTPEAFVAHLVLIFREVWRVLRDDGACLVNLGDSFAQSTSRFRNGTGPIASACKVAVGRLDNGRSTVGNGVKQKDLLGIPWRFAFALQADGWWLRSVITWCKAAPMPQSARDRPTTATEELFLFAKASKYFYDADGCRPAAEYGRQEWYRPLVSGTENGDGHRSGGGGVAVKNPGATRNLWNWWDLPTDDGDEPARLRWLLGPEPLAHNQGRTHYASFPTEIPLRAWKLLTSQRGACPACGAPWRRVVERKANGKAKVCPKDGDSFDERFRGREGLETSGLHSQYLDVQRETLGWQPTCKCDRPDVIPCLTLDPFCGSGTSGLAARLLGRRFVGFEPSATYAALARQRIGGATPLADAIERAAVTERTLFDEGEQ